jgi:hypothetical protein
MTQEERKRRLLQSLLAPPSARVEIENPEATT